jgi:chromosome segregation ATPase
MNNDFFVMMLLFLLITFLISTIIVLFLSKIKTLTAVLEHAKEIDTAKEDKISFLDEALQEEKIINLELKRDLDYLSQSKEKLDLSIIEITELKEKLIYQSKDYVDLINEHKNSFEELKNHYDVLESKQEKLEESYNLLQKRNEALVNDNNKLHTKIREVEITITQRKK